MANPVAAPLPPQRPDAIVYSAFPTKGMLGPQIGFYEPSANYLIRQTAVEVVRHEGPISLELATRRVASHWELDRIHEKATKRVLDLVRGTDIIIESSEAGTFLWPSGVDPAAYAVFRVPGDDPMSARNPEDLPLQELANGALSVLRENISAPEEDVLRGTARLFGFRRSGRIVTYRMQAGIELLIQRGLAVRNGETLTIREEGR
jgi:hypothetical protein